MPVGEVAAIGGVAEEIAAQPVNRIGDEAIGEQVCNINLNSAYPLKCCSVLYFVWSILAGILFV